MSSILLVEDDPDIRESFRDLLQYNGYHVLEARTGKDALKLLEQDPLPALVLLDMMLPVMSGNELLHAMRQSDRTAKVPVVILSTGTKLMGSKDLARYASTYGVSAALAKPISPDRLLEVLQRLVPRDEASAHA